MTELFGVHGLVVAVIALLVIGPKDLPKAMRVLGYWVGKARGVARQFRSGFDAMVREAELAEMEKKWAAENARILAEHPHTEPEPLPSDREALPTNPPTASQDDPEPDLFSHPQLVEKPVVAPAELHTPPAADAKAPS